MFTDRKRHIATSWILLAASAACNLAAFWTGPSDAGFSFATFAILFGIATIIESIRALITKDNQ